MLTVIVSWQPSVQWLDTRGLEVDRGRGTRRAAVPDDEVARGPAAERKTGTGATCRDSHRVNPRRRRTLISALCSKQESQPRPAKQPRGPRGSRSRRGEGPIARTHAHGQVGATHIDGYSCNCTGSGTVAGPPTAAAAPEAALTAAAPAAAAGAPEIFAVMRLEHSLTHAEDVLNTSGSCRIPEQLHAIDFVSYRAALSCFLAPAVQPLHGRLQCSSSTQSRC